VTSLSCVSNSCPAGKGFFSLCSRKPLLWPVGLMSSFFFFLGDYWALFPPPPEMGRSLSAFLLGRAKKLFFFFFTALACPSFCMYCLLTRFFLCIRQVHFWLPVCLTNPEALVQRVSESRSFEQHPLNTDTFAETRLFFPSERFFSGSLFFFDPGLGECGGPFL